MLKISVITVCYNAAATLRDCIHSVACQDYPFVEHILVDGGSSDGTMALVSEFPYHFSHIVSESDNGIYDAMNKGLKLATGDIVAFLNADDRYLSGNVLSRIANLMESRQLDVLYGDVTYFHASNPYCTVRYYKSRPLDLRSLSCGWMPAHPAFFMRREIYEIIGGFNADYRIAGDFELIARAFSTIPLRHDYVPCAMVAMQTGGASTQLTLRRLLRQNKELLRASKENGISTNIFKVLSRYPSKLLEIFNRR